ncbi:MAG: ParB/RepB/Spo0J family partition protein [Planctomycetes bacterium]|nr:ParB/RepB/Spo0J family partition protein [Planctomycetota bacterium]
MERRLGRGLGALLAPDPAPPAPHAEVPLAKIRPNPFQPRKTFGPESLTELQESIKLHGVMQPVVLRSAPGGYELIAGERRFRACQALGLQSIPAVIRDGVPDQAMLELALVENLQRADLDPIEKAKGFRQLMDQGLTQEELARRVGMQRSTVANFLRLLELSEAVQRVVTEGLLSMGHARALLGLSDSRRQEELCALAVRRGLSVRDVELRVRELEGRAQPKKATIAPSPPPWVREMEARMRGHLGTKVQVRNGEGYQGQIVVEYHGREDLDRLYSLLAPKKML